MRAHLRPPWPLPHQVPALDPSNTITITPSAYTESRTPSHRKRPARGKALERRQDGQSANVLAISWQAQQRLHRVWRRLDGKRGTRRTIVAVAVARELAGFCWALARAD